MDDDANPLSQSPFSRGNAIPSAVQIVFRWGFVLVVLTALAYIVYSLASDDSDDGVSDDGTAAESVATDDEGSVDADPAGQSAAGTDEGSVAEDPATESPQSDDPEPVTDPAPEDEPPITTTTAPPQPEATPDTQPAPTLAGNYVALLAAYSVEGAADEERAILEEQYGQSFAVLSSSDYASLAPGLFVVYDGPFVTSEEAQSACWNLDRRTVDVCYARKLSQDPADAETAYPPAAPA